VNTNRSLSWATDEERERGVSKVFRIEMRGRCGGRTKREKEGDERWEEVVVTLEE